MTITETHEYFDLLTDKVGSGYWTDGEKDNFLTQGCLLYVKDLFPSNEGGVVNVELDETTYTNIHTLVYELPLAYSNTVAISNLQTALNTATGGSDPWMYILRLSLTSGGTTYPVRWVKQNNWNAYERNVFKQGSVSDPHYKFDAQYLRFSPTQTINGTPLSITVVKQPRAVSLDENIAIELPPHTHQDIVRKAVQLASEGLRDMELAQLNQVK